MIEAQTKEVGFVADYQSLKGLLNACGPEAWQEMRERAIRAWTEFGIPTHRDEEFKYLPLRALEETHYAIAYGANVYRESVSRTLLGEIQAATITFVNGQPAPELDTAASLPAGVVISTLQEAAESHPEVVSAHLAKVSTLQGKLGSSNDERFALLNTAFLQDGAFVYIPRGAMPELPIHIQFLTTADQEAIAIHPRVLIVVEDGAAVKIVESYTGLGGSPTFVNAVTEVFVGARANVEHIRYQGENADAVHIGNLAVHQEADSVYTSNVATLGAKTSRLDLNLWINGEHTESWLNGAYVGTGDQLHDSHTRIDHAFANCNSFEVYKGILKDKAQGVFNGKIFVYQDAQKTDAKQTNQAILLSPEAGVNTKPQLEIFADDVKCTHGATVGQLREDALFYLRARGVPLDQAQALLVYAFAAEVLEKITLDDVREALEAELYRKLNAA
jgi:Fe-S cluster assembly protein SufD